ncbi:hypothetical protein DPMN_142672 [Dreissena polymorpha]|uniref:Uncharacterized protein n=1 Tax=Dreissena polymorpha TaxID=45954 RepID=A0A9D4GC35_DREPO|nr:hypothetical protein DPMN_142672 [Dreissena polymorpha]
MIVLIGTSVVQVPSLDRFFLMYLKQIIVSIFSPFSGMSARGLVVLFTMIFYFSILTSNCFIEPVGETLTFTDWASNEVILSANFNMKLGLPTFEIEE